MSGDILSRRRLLQLAGSAAASLALDGAAGSSAWATRTGTAPTATVGIERCASYALPMVVARLAAVIDRTGGLGALVRGKTVAVKVNLTGSPGGGALGLSPGRTYHVHPTVVQALAVLLARSGARRIRFLEGTYTRSPIENTLSAMGWDLSALSSVGIPVEYEDTRNRGLGAGYRKVTVPGGGDIFPAYLLNHSYEDCDVYISLAKLKNHTTAGVTLSLKNNFGITPTSLYAQGDRDENSTDARQDVLHTGETAPPAGVPRELHPQSPRVPSYRVPRVIADLAGIRPIDLAIIDGVETVSGGEGPWCPDLALQTPGLLLAGRNAVCTDAIAMVCMGCDPLSAARTGPFPGDNHLALCAARGVGANDPGKIEVAGLSLTAARHPFGWQPSRRNT